METKSYEFNGKRYDFVLSLRAKIEIEKAQKAKYKTPAMAKIVESLKGSDLSSFDTSKMNPEQIAEILPYMDTLEELDPIEIGWLVLSNYGSYRNDITRELYDNLVDDMDMKLGAVAAYEFFVQVREMVFTQLATMQKMEQVKAESQVATANFVNQK